MVFTLPVRSTGISTGPTTGVYTLCVYWDVKVTYDLGARGQVRERERGLRFWGDLSMYV